MSSDSKALQTVAELGTSRSALTVKCPPKQEIAQTGGHGKDGLGMIGRVSFDLYAFPAPGPRTVAEVRQLLEIEEVEDLRFDRDTRSWLPPPGEQMAKFVAELEKRWPSLDDDPEGSPWSSWPLWAPVAGGGSGLNIGWSWAASAMPAILEIAARTNVVIYDPQAAQLIRPREACN